MTFADIRREFGADGSYPPDLPRPTTAYFRKLQRRFGRTYPEVFVLFQTVEAFNTPMAAHDWDGFGWAAPGLDAYMSLRAALEDAAHCDLALSFAPFRMDEGNLYCLDTSHIDSAGACPVVFWDHDERAILDVPHLTWPSFVAWLWSGLERDRSRYGNRQ